MTASNSPTADPGARRGSFRLRLPVPSFGLGRVAPAWRTLSPAWRRLALTAAGLAGLVLAVVLWLALSGPPGSGHSEEPAHEVPRVEIGLPARPAAGGADPARAALGAGPGAAPAPNLPPWRAYAQPFSETEARPRIAIIVFDLGLSEASTRAAIRQMPGEITLAFSPYVRDLAGWLRQARDARHEVLLMVPMEPGDYPRDDPGPQTLLTSLGPDDNRRRLSDLLDRAAGVVGVIDAMGGRFITAPDSLRPVLAALEARGMMFVDSGSSPHTMAGRLASEVNLPHATSDRTLGGGATAEAIDQRLTELETLARSRGAAVGIALPDPLTFERLAQWIPTLAAKGLVLAPITAVANRQPDP